MGKAQDLLGVIEGEKVYNLFIKRGGTYGEPWNKKPLPMKELEKMVDRIKKAAIPSVDMGSELTLEPGKYPKGK